MARVTLAACALLLLVPASAGAHRFNAPTSAEVVSGGPAGAEGTVSSPRPACERNRLVELFRVDELGGAPQSYGTARTDRAGNWSIETSLFAGEYYVTVKESRAATASKKKKKKKKKKHRHRCQAGESEPERL